MLAGLPPETTRQRDGVAPFPRAATTVCLLCISSFKHAFLSDIRLAIPAYFSPDSIVSLGAARDANARDAAHSHVILAETGGTI
jgi:hypothetical protein